MEAAASIVGLLAVATKVYTFLEEFVSTCVDAPAVAQVMCDELRDFRYALRRLRSYVDQPTQINPLGAAVTDVNQLSLTLDSCVVTFSQLEKTLDRLLSRKGLDTIGRVRWALSAGSLSQLVTRLQQHKMTLMLLLTIWLTESSPQAEECLGHLNDVLTQITAPTPHPPPAPAIPTDNILDGADLVRSSSPAVVGSHNVPQLAFESALYTSKPYKHIKRTGSSAWSLSTSQKRGTQWSVFSGGSSTSVFSLPYTSFELAGAAIAQAPNASTIHLPTSANTLYNPTWYNRGGISSSGSIPTALGSSSRGPTSHDITLHDAVGRGDILAAVRELLLGPDPNSGDYSGRRALHCAILGNNKLMAETLLDLGAGVNAWSVEDGTALQLAIMLKNVEMVGMLLDRGASADTRDEDGRTPLYLAVKSSNTAIVELILDRGASIDTTCGIDRTTPLHLAVSMQHEGMVEVLLGRGASIDAKGAKNSTALHTAVAMQHERIFEMLLNRGASIDAVDEKETTALHIAVAVQHERMVERLLDPGANIEAKQSNGRTALHVSASKNKVDIIRLLLDRGAEVDSQMGPHLTPVIPAGRTGFES